MGEHTDFLAGAANGDIILIENDADLLHQPNLLFIVTRKISVILRNFMCTR